MNFLTSSERMEQLFEKYFQKTVTLSINDEVMKKGKFLLIKNCIIGNNYFYELTIERAKKLDIVKLPYPFELEEYPEDDLMYMDYRLSTLFKNNKEALEGVKSWIKQVNIKNPNKMFDSIVELKFE